MSTTHSKIVKRLARNRLIEARHLTRAAKSGADLKSLALGSTLRIPWPANSYEVDKIDSQGGVDTFAGYFQTPTGEEPTIRSPYFIFFGAKGPKGKYQFTTVEKAYIDKRNRENPGEPPLVYSDYFDEDLRDFFKMTVAHQLQRNIYIQYTRAKFQGLPPQAKARLRAPYEF